MRAHSVFVPPCVVFCVGGEGSRCVSARAAAALVTPILCKCEFEMQIESAAKN